MKNEILDILKKWTMNGKIDQHHYEDMATELAEMLAKNLQKAHVSGQVCEHGEWKTSGIRPDQMICGKCGYIQYR